MKWIHLPNTNDVEDRAQKLAHTYDVRVNFCLFFYILIK